MTTSRPPLVVFGDDWGRHVSTMQHLLRHLFDRYPTVWVNGIGHRVPGVKDAGRAWQKVRNLVAAPTHAGASNSNAAAAAQAIVTQPAERAVLAPAVIVHPAVLPMHHWPGVGRLNGWSLTRAIRNALDSIGGGRPIVVTGSPPSVSVAGRLDELATVYFCMDDWAHLPGVSPQMLLPLEQRLLERVDAVVATSKELTRLKVPANGRSEYLPQGVNYDHFSRPRQVPPEFAALPRPWIGFAGGVGPALDPNIVRSVASAFAHGSVILVGPAQDGMPDIDGPNVHRLGPRPYDVLPAYVQAFDAGIIPYVRNPWTESVDPLKLLEYLAAGIPVITTDLPEVWKYQEVVTITSDPTEFAAAVGAAVSDDTSERVAHRQNVAARNSWQSRAEVFATILDDVVNQLATSPDAVSRSARIVGSM